MRIAFCGLGNMGSAMARNLLRAGHQLTVYNRGRSAADALANDGAAVAATAAQAAAASEMAITMLADDHAVESVALGNSGVAEGLPAGAVHVSMSTISPELAQRLAAEHNKRGQQYISAPVFGRPEAAAAAKLFIVAAGAHAAKAKTQPALDVMGQRVFDLGEQPEHANFVKLLGNFLITCVLEGLGEDRKSVV